MLNGKKTVESRYTKNRIFPYNKISEEDIVLIKKSCGDVLGYFTIKEVIFFELGEIDIECIKSKFGSQLCVTETFWEAKKNSNYATLIVIDEIVKLKPFYIDKKGMQTWIKFDKEQ